MMLRILQSDEYVSSFLSVDSVPVPRIDMRKIKDVLRLKRTRVGTDVYTND